MTILCLSFPCFLNTLFFITCVWMPETRNNWIDYFCLCLLSSLLLQFLLLSSWVSSTCYEYLDVLLVAISSRLLNLQCRLPFINLIWRTSSLLNGSCLEFCFIINIITSAFSLSLPEICGSFIFQPYCVILPEVQQMVMFKKLCSGSGLGLNSNSTVY